MSTQKEKSNKKQAVFDYSSKEYKAMVDEWRKQIEKVLKSTSAKGGKQ